MTTEPIERHEATLAVTGGTGFIARGVLHAAAQAGLSCRALSRSPRPEWAGPEIHWSTVASYADTAVLSDALSGASHVLHLADNPARTEKRGAEEAVRNADALIEAARTTSVRGVIVASSVYARQADPGEPSSYGTVKRAIEERFLAAEGIRGIILRLPPVYGPGGSGGLATLSRLVRKGVPLPLGAAKARRAYLSRRNLASLVITMVDAGDRRWDEAAGRIFEPSDGVAISTHDLIRAMASRIGVSARLVAMPEGLLRAVAGVTGKSDLVKGAIDPLVVAPVDELDAAFGWRPVEQMPESLDFLAREPI